MCIRDSLYTVCGESEEDGEDDVTAEEKVCPCRKHLQMEMLSVQTDINVHGKHQIHDQGHTLSLPLPAFSLRDTHM